MSMKILTAIKKYLILEITGLSQNTSMLKKLVIGIVKDKTGGIVIEKFVALKAKMYSFLVDSNSEHKIAKGMNRNVLATIGHNKYNNVL